MVTMVRANYIFTFRKHNEQSSNMMVNYVHSGCTYVSFYIKM